MDAQPNAYSSPQDALVADTGTFCEPRFLSLSGRIGRLRYLAYGTGLTLITYVLLGVAMAVVFGVGLAGNTDSAWLFAAPVLLLAYIPLLTFSWGYIVRRLNDLNHTGWLSLLILVPLANIGLVLYLVFGKGSETANKYGAPPPPNTRSVIFLGCILPAIMIAGILSAIALPAYWSYQQADYEAAVEPMGGAQSAQYDEPTVDTDATSPEDIADEGTTTTEQNEETVEPSDSEAEDEISDDTTDSNSAEVIEPTSAQQL